MRLHMYNLRDHIHFAIELIVAVFYGCAAIMMEMNGQSASSPVFLGFKIYVLIRRCAEHVIKDINSSEARVAVSACRMIPGLVLSSWKCF